MSKVINLKIEPKNKIFIFSPSIQANECQFVAYAISENGNKVDVTDFSIWESNDHSIVEVNNKGLGKVKKTGEAEIKATFNGVSSTTSFNSKTLVTISTTLKNSYMRKGESSVIKASLQLDDGQVIDGGSDVLWTSSNTDVVKIDNLGNITVVDYKPSETSIAIRARHQSKYGETILTIGPKMDLEVSSSSSNLDLSKSNNVQFKSFKVLEDGSKVEVTNATTWKSSNTHVAQIDPNGFLNGYIGGEVTITGEYKEGQFSPIQHTYKLSVLPDRSKPVILSYIELDQSEVTINMNQSVSKRMIATAFYSDGTKEDITHTSLWSIADSTVAIISPRGIITALQVGKTTLTINKDNKILTIPLEVNQIVVSTMIGLEIEPKNALLPWNDGYSTLQYQALAVMDNGEKIDVTLSTTWSSSNPVISSISINGTAISKAKGNTMIRASYGGFNQDTSLHTDAQLERIEIIPSGIEFEIGKKSKLEVVAHYSNYPSRNITNIARWVSSNTNIVSVQANGLVKGEKVGVATIRAYYFGVTSEIRATILQSPIFMQKLIISPSNSSLPLEFGNTVQFSVEGVFNNGTTQKLTKDVIWEVSDPTIAMISDLGLLTSTTVLTDTSIQIKATYKDLSEVTSLVVKPIPLPDLTPPGSITNIWEENMGTTIQFIFRLPTDVDFHSVKVYRDGMYIGETQTSMFEDSGLILNTNYTYEFTTVDTSGNESDPVRYHTVAHPPVDVNYRQPLTWSGNLSVNQNNQTYSVNSNKFPVGDVSDQIFNPYLVSWQDIQCASCESIYQMMRNHTPLEDFKVSGWKYVTIAEGNTLPTQGIKALNILQYMNSEELYWGAWCKDCGSVVYSKIYMKEFNSRVELGMTFFKNEQIVPKYVFKLPASVKLDIPSTKSIGQFTIYDPESKTNEELSLMHVMSTEHLIMRGTEVFGKISFNATMDEISIELRDLPAQDTWDKEFTYALSINKEHFINLDKVDKYDVLQGATWENKPDGTPTKLNRTYVGYNILFNYSTTVDHKNDYDPKWPYYVEDEWVIPEIVPDGIRNLFGWGNNNYGQLGDGTILTKYSPAETFATDIISAAAGTNHSLAVQKNGFVLTWGRNTNGQLGHGVKDNFYHHTPTIIKNLDHVIDVAAGWFHSLALEEDGTVWAWGGNYRGQLGDGTLVERIYPTQVKGPQSGAMYLEDIVQIGAGADFSTALDKNGDVWQWGRDILTPTKVPGLQDIIQIASGAWHTLALKRDGTVWAWGYNWSGQLGIGVWEYTNGYDVNNGYNDVIQIVNLSNIKEIAAGNDHSLALSDSGAIYAWGDNEFGQVGTTINRNKYWPIKIPSIDTINHISAGEYSTFAIRADNTVWAWGDNSSGVLGVGDTQATSEPRQIIGLDGEIERIVAGREHSLAIKLLPGTRP